MASIQVQRLPPSDERSVLPQWFVDDMVPEIYQRQASDMSGSVDIFQAAKVTEMAGEAPIMHGGIAALNSVMRSLHTNDQSPHALSYNGTTVASSEPWRRSPSISAPNLQEKKYAATHLAGSSGDAPNSARHQSGFERNNQRRFYGLQRSTVADSQRPSQPSRGNQHSNDFRGPMTSCRNFATRSSTTSRYPPSSAAIDWRQKPTAVKNNLAEGDGEEVRNTRGLESRTTSETPVSSAAAHAASTEVEDSDARLPKS